MQTIGKRLLKKLSVVMLVIIMMLMLFPLTVNAADHPVVISSGDSVSEIYNAIQAKIDAAANGDTVTVTGSKSNAADVLSLIIPAGKKVIWKAVYGNDVSLNDPLISLNGTGTFEVADDAYLKHTNASQTIVSNNNYIIVSGGAVEATSTYGKAIETDQGSVTVSGGTVKTSGAYAQTISTTSGHVTVTGTGTVIAGNGESAAIYTNSGDVAVSGGSVKAEGGGNTYAIETESGDVMVSGGVVSSTSGYAKAIYAHQGNVTVTGTGIVKADGGWYGTTIHAPDGNVTVSGGKVEYNGDYSTTIDANSGNVTVLGGVITANGNYCKAIYTGSPSNGGNVTVSGGTVTATGENASAIETRSGEITISGGTISVIGDWGWTIWSDGGNIIITGGEILLSGADSTGSAVSVAGQNATIKITGGTVTATGDNAKAIWVQNYSAAAYLAGTCSGILLNYDDTSMIVEVDSLVIPASRHNTDEGLTIKAGEIAENSVKWNIPEGATIPVIVFSMYDGMEVTYNPEIPWGTLESTLPNTGDNRNTSLWLLICSISLLGLGLSAEARKRYKADDQK